MNQLYEHNPYADESSWSDWLAERDVRHVATQVFTLIAGMAIGAGLMYLFDPSRGKARRHLIRDQAGRYARDAGRSIRQQSEHLRDRTQGMARSAINRVRSDDATDWQLHERVRSALGRAVGNPGAIVVEVNDGVVTLSGPVLAEELDGLMSAAGSVRGVRDVVNRLAVHDSPASVPGLQRG